MYSRAKYQKSTSTPWQSIPNHVVTPKYDGAHFWMEVQGDGSLKYYSRRQSVKGHYPERSAQLPQLTAKKMPHLAGQVFSVELIHTGKNKYTKESHPAVSGILNSLPAKSIKTQEEKGPIRAVLIDVINPSLKTYKDKLLHLKQVEEAYGNPDVLFAPPIETTKEGIVKLIAKTKAEGREGVIATSLSLPESNNPRIKVKHFDTYNLKIVRLIQEVDIYGKPKNAMGAADCVDASGRVVCTVGSGFTREQREEAFNHPDLWMGRTIQVKTMGLGSVGGKLRAPVFNGDSDSPIDRVE